MSYLSPKQLVHAVLALVVLGAMILFTGPAWAGSGLPLQDDQYLIDEQGRPLRVAFPLHDRILFDFYGFNSSAANAHPGPWGLGLRLAIEHSFEASYPEEEIWWRFRHRWFDARGSVQSNHLQLGMTFLSATYMRHATASYITVFIGEGLQIPTPFDIAFEYEVFDATYDMQSRRMEAVKVAEFAILLDFLRRSDYRHRLALGALMSYETEELPGRNESDGQEGLVRTHTFIPASGGRLVYRWENSPGRMAIDLRLQCAATAILINQEISWHPLCDGQLKVERTVLAIADRPVNLFLEGALQEAPDLPEFGPSLQWRATLGVRLSLPGTAR